MQKLDSFKNSHVTDKARTLGCSGQMKDSSIIAFSTGRVKLFDGPYKETVPVGIDSHPTDNDSANMGTMTTNTSKKWHDDGGPLSAKYERLVMAGRLQPQLTDRNVMKK